MTQVFYHNPGQLVTIVLETFDSDGKRSDGYADGYADGYVDGYYTLPKVNSIIFPDLTAAPTYPKPMVRLDKGLYYYKFTLPKGYVAVGTYIADVFYIDPSPAILKKIAYQIVVTAVAGNFG